MPPTVIARCILLGLLAVAGPGCSANAPHPLGADGDSTAPEGGLATAFSGDRAFAHLGALAAIGPRAVGTEGVAQARAYLTDQLRELGLSVESRTSAIDFDTDGLPSLELVNLEAEIPGASPELIVLAAPYDSAYRESFAYLGVNDGGSGAALLLEIARVLVANPLPYTIRLLFLDGEAPLGRGTDDDKQARNLGSTAAAYRMQSENEFDSIRLLILINRVSDADLRIARDRFSHRTYRDVIWKVAADLGHDDVFSPGDTFDAPQAGHRAFIAQGMRRVIAIVDPRLGSEELPEAGEFTEDDTLERSTPRSLEVIGEVILASLQEICARLVKIDRFSEVPVPDEAWIAPEPAPEIEPENGSEPDADPEVENDEKPADGGDEMSGEESAP